MTTLVAVGLVVAALLSVVVGQAMVANGQVRLSAIEHKLTMEQATHRQIELQVSQGETPARIVGAASGRLHMIHPSLVTELPYVPLTTPIATPKVTPAPAATTTSTTVAPAP